MRFSVSVETMTNARGGSEQPLSFRSLQRSFGGIQVLQALAERIGSDFHPHVEAILPLLIERLGDSKDAVSLIATCLKIRLS